MLWLEGKTEEISAKLFWKRWHTVLLGCATVELLSMCEKCFDLQSILTMLTWKFPNFHIISVRMRRVQQFWCTCSNISNIFSDHIYHHYVLKREGQVPTRPSRRWQKKRVWSSVCTSWQGSIPWVCMGPYLWDFLLRIQFRILFSPIAWFCTSHKD